MNIQEEHQNYKHFEAWASEYVTNLDLPALVRVYNGAYPGRTNRLMTELIQVARMWTEVHQQSGVVKHLNDIEEQG